MAPGQELVRLAGIAVVTSGVYFACGGLPSSVLTPLVSIGCLQLMAVAQSIASSPSRRPGKAAKASEETAPDALMDRLQRWYQAQAGPLRLAAILFAALAPVALSTLCHMWQGESVMHLALSYSVKAATAFVLGGVFHLCLQWEGDGTLGGAADDRFRCPCGRGCGVGRGEQCPYSDNFWDD
eukprot:gb/GFBE01022426.1/.p1 GENE.gb/GFBE01022426.1/~~gb/GFBE01022426.1/.p1  ORF type:complete len:182 (+),score=27.48 gb/GFBE01022426.1/:1-546(+)